jgi:hypothetical protein
MIGTQPNTIYLGRNSDPNGIPFRFLPFKPSPVRTKGGKNLFTALINSTLNVSDQVGTPYQFSFIISLTGPIVAGSIYNNSNASLTYDVTLNLSGTISFSVTDVNGTSTITTTQALEPGWSYELTFQYTYNGQFIPLTFFPRSDFMNIFINGIRAATGIDVDGDASVTPALAASTLSVNSSATSAVAAIAQWYSAWWVSFAYVFAWQWWYYWWYAWWRSQWWSYWYQWWWWWWFVECDLGPCDPSTCGSNSCHPEAPFDTMYLFDRMTGDIDFVLAGVGIRDINTNDTPAQINITVPGTVLRAYLYWNTIGGGQQQAACPNTAIVNGNPFTGDIIGCTGNTCWSAFCRYSGNASDPGQEDQNILNKVWFADVKSVVTGSGSYNIELPNVVPNDIVCTNASDSPRYPGCTGGQGIALLVIYQTEPQVVTRPRQHCCVPVGNDMVTERTTREIIVWHGARLLTCPGGGDCATPPSIGGDNEYTISWKTKYTWSPKIATAVGDAQSKLADSFYWNGVALPPSPSYFNPYAGNLLHVKTEYLPAHTAKCDCGGAQENTVRAFTPDDCLCWFLFVYSGAQKCITPAITSSQQSFTSPPTPMMSLWNPNPPDCCPVRLPCCGDVCLPAKLNVSITAPTLECSCFGTQGYIMQWNKTENKYILQSTSSACGCTLFGWLYCIGAQWVLYLALSEEDTICSDGLNVAFPINCSPFGGVGNLQLSPVNLCSCGCITDLLTVSVSPG